MKPHLPKALRTALLATFAAILTLGSATTAATYSNLREVSIDADNHVYYNGNGTFYVQSAQDTTLELTLDLNQFVSYQGSNDYTGFTPFVAWTFANGISDGIADVSTKNNVSSYAGLTGYYGSNKYALSGNGQSSLTLTTLQSYATDNMVTVTVRNNLTGGVSLTLGSGDNAVTYQNTGLKFSNQNTSTTSYSVNTQYVTSVKINTASTLDTDSFELPPDYSQPFHSDRWDAGDATSLGRVLFVGDSITHGVGEQTWRWQIFKTMVDNGIENEIAGPRSDYDTRFANTTSDRGMTSYAGVEFNNVHLAQSSGRTHNIITGSSNISGVNYGGWSTSKTAAAYDADTMICLMGTNDILSDGGALITKFSKLLGGTVSYDDATKHYTWEHNDSNSWGEWGTMGSIMGDLMKQEGDTMYVMSIPTWGVRNDLKYGPNGNVDIESAHHGVQEYNGMLKQWTEQYSAATGKKVKYVDVNRGLVDLTDSVSFKGYTKFFREGGDQLHPTEQGSLIIAGNLAQGMGLAGRTAGLTRSQVGHEDHGWQTAAQSINLAAGQTQQAIADKFTIEGGYTIDFKALFGDGAANGWKGLDAALSVAIGDGTNGGTLKLSEGYIAWGDTVLFCQDNHLTTNESLRVAYHQGNAEQNIGGGYYVWLGDMLIGQALNAGSSTLNGVTLTSTGGNAVISGLSYANTAYAPSTTLTTALDNGLSHVTPPSQPEETLTPMPSGDRNMTVTPTTISGTPLTQQYAVTANNGQSTVNLTGSAADWNGAVNSAGHHGDVNVEVVGNATTANLFGVVQGTVEKSDAEGDTGSVKMVVGNSVVVGKQKFVANWGGGTSEQDYVAIAGSFRSVIDGTFALELNQATVGGDIVMGVVNARDRGSVGATELTMNAGAVVNGNIYGGSYDSHGEVKGNAEITINGGTVNGNVEGGGKTGGVAGGNGTIKGDVSIAINGGVITGDVTIGGGTIEGKSTVTVTGNKASIGGNITVAGENGKVILKDVSDSGYSDGFDQYGKKNIGEEGKTISAANLELNNYTAQEVHAKLEGEHLVVKEKSVTTVSNLTLTACDITVEGGSTLILSGTQTYGHTATYSGALTIAEGTTFTVTNPTEGTSPGTYTSGDNGFKYSGNIYDVLTPESPAVDHLLGTDGNTLGLVTNLTLKGGEGMENYFFVYKTDTGILSAYENIETSTCYITKGSLTYGRQTGAYGATESLKLSSGATLVMADNLVDGVTINSAGGNVELLENVTLSKSSFAADSTATLTGTGTFALGTATAAGDITMPTGFTLDSAEWKGSVLLTTDGKTVQAITAASLNALAPNADAWVELHKVKGYFENADTTISANLRLMGEEALHIDNSYGKTYTFTGEIAGDGSFVHSFDNQNYKFQGDISQWFGSFSTAVNSWNKRATAVTLEGKATTINAALASNPGSNLNLTLGNITNGAEGYTFNNMVKVHDLSAAGKTVILGAADDVVPGGHLTVGGTATMGKLIAAEGTTATFNGTSVQLSADNAYKTSNVEAAKATISLADGTNVRVSGDSNIGTLHIGGNVSIADNSNVNYVQSATIHNLSSEAGAHLTLAAVFDTSLNTTYTLGGANTMASANDFNGTIEFKRNNSSTGVTKMILADTNIAKDAVIELNNANAGREFGIGLAASTVKVQGIQDAAGSKGGLIFSGSNYNSTDATVRTLEITGNGTYSTAATVGANINLMMSGTGTQTFTGDMSAFSGLVYANGGKLVLANSASSSEAVALKGIFVNQGTLELSGGKYTVGGSDTNTNGLFADTNHVYNGALVLSNGATLDVNAVSKDWRFQVNSGKDAGLYVKGEGSALHASLNEGGEVTFKALDTNSETGARVVKTSGNGQSFSTGNANIAVSDADYAVKSASAKTVANTLLHTAITNEGTGLLTVTNSANTLVGVDAEGGSIEVQNAASSATSLKELTAEGGDVTIKGLGDAVTVNLNELYIADSRTVSLYQDGNAIEASEANVMVSGTLKAGEGATLNGNLVLGTNAKLDFAGENGLHMGSSLTLQSGSTVTLGDLQRGSVAALIRFEELVLFTGVDSFSIGGAAYDSTLTYSATDYFNLSGLSNAQDLTIKYNNGAVSLYMETPEPATATLSLLALAALAARRKRK